MNVITITLLIVLPLANSVRLNKLFQILEGYTSVHSLKGFLHVGNQYTVFIRTPEAHAKYLVYELYESKNIKEPTSYKPRLIAKSKVPIAYIKEQLLIFHYELYRAKFIDSEVVPGTQVLTLKEWQIRNKLKKQDMGTRLHIFN